MKLRTTLIIVILLAAGVNSASASEEALQAAREAFDKAQTLFEAEKYEEATELFDKAYTAKPFPQFLFNIGACHERLQHWQLAVDYYNRYLAEEPGANDKAKLKKRIEVLKREAERVKNLPTPPPETPEGTPPPEGDPANVAATPPKPSEEVTKLQKVTVRGLVAVESEPASATIYLDNRDSKPLKTPWSGTLEGEHTVFIERKGYEPVEKKIYAAPDRFAYYWFGLTKQDYLGWIEITSNIPEAEIYIDNKAAGVYQRTPFAGNLKPGKHTIWVTKEGYNEFKTTVEVINGQTHEVKADLKGSPVGYLDFRGSGIEKSTIYMDGTVLCERGPCRKPVEQGKHKIKIKREDYKTYRQLLDVQAKTETTVQATLAEEPGRGDAWTALIFGAAFIGGGVYAYTQAEDPPFCDAGSTSAACETQTWEIGSLVLGGLGAASVAAGIYYFIRDKGPPSTGKVDVKAIAVTPSVSPNYAGLGLTTSF